MWHHRRTAYFLSSPRYRAPEDDAPLTAGRPQLQKGEARLKRPITQLRHARKPDRKALAANTFACISYYTKAATRNNSAKQKRSAPKSDNERNHRDTRGLAVAASCVIPSTRRPAGDSRTSITDATPPST
jgi:hypothetical protein